MWTEKLALSSGRLSAGVGVREVNVSSGRLIGERWILRCVVNVISLNTFKEHTEAAPDDCRLPAWETVGKAYSRLPRVVLVLNDSTREAIDAGRANAIEVERLAIKLRERRWVERAVRVQRKGERSVVVV